MSRAGYLIRETTPADDAALRALLRAMPMRGNLTVTFEREPSFFAGECILGAFHQTLVACGEGDELVGLGTRSVSDAFVNGHPTPVGYLGDLRILPGHRRGTLLARAYRQLRELHDDGRTQLYTTVIFADNEPALRLLASGRAGLPAYRDLGMLRCPGLRIGRRALPMPRDVEIAPCPPDQLSATVEFLNRHNAERQFAPVHQVTDFLPGGRWHGVDAAALRIARRSGEIVGVIARWDQRPFRQTRLHAYHGAARWLAPAVRRFSTLLGRRGPPAPGSVIPFFHAAFLAATDPGVAEALLRLLHNEAVGGDSLFMIAGLHERDPLSPALDGFRKIDFRGRLFCVVHPENEPDFQSLDNRVPHAEAATL